jgi:hypothetical protein
MQEQCRNCRNTKGTMQQLCRNTEVTMQELCRNTEGTMQELCRTLKEHCKKNSETLHRNSAGTICQRKGEENGARGCQRAYRLLCQMKLLDPHMHYR